VYPAGSAGVPKLGKLVGRKFKRRVEMEPRRNRIALAF
jgi:hypothetical protein